MISNADVNKIVDFVRNRGLSEAVMSELRNSFSSYHFTYCMDDDMEVYRPARELDEFNIYFIDSSDHCAKPTQDAGKATGMVLAEKIEDDD